MAGPGLEERRAYNFGLGFGYECGQLQQDALLRVEDANVLQAKVFSQLEVYSVCCIIQIRMSSINDQIVLARFHDATLYIVCSRQRLEGLKHKRMVCNDQITSEFDSFIDHRFGHIQTEKCALCRLIDITHLNA